MIATHFRKITIDRQIAEADDTNMLARLVVAIDPVTGEKACEVYSDDGRGNGDLILSFLLPH